MADACLQHSTRHDIYMGCPWGRVADMLLGASADLQFEVLHFPLASGLDNDGCRLVTALLALNCHLQPRKNMEGVGHLWLPAAS